MLSSWYQKDELPFRIAILYAGNTISNCFGGLIAAGVLGGMNDAAGIHSWRWLFILEGCFTIFIAIIAGFVLPSYPKGNPPSRPATKGSLTCRRCDVAY